MRALIVFPEYPYPLNSGSKVAVNAYVGSLRQYGAAIDLVCFDTAPGVVNRPWFADVLHISKPSRIRPMEFVKSIARRDSYLFRRFTSKKAQEAVRAFVRNRDYDIVIVAHAYMLSTLPPEFRRRMDGRLVISAEVLEGPALQTKASLERARWRRTLLEREAFLALSAELQAFQSARLVFFYSAQESALYRQNTGETNGRHVRLGLDLANYLPTSGPKTGASCAFYGDFAWYPNADGLNYLLTDIWPHIHNRMPSVVLRIAGRRIPEWAHRYADRSVEIVGAVPSIQDFIRTNSIVLAPLRIGGGTRLKVLEAMALGIPVVGSPRSLEGIDAVVGEAVLCADEPQDFAEHAARLLRERHTWERVSDCAREYVQRYHSYQTSTAVALRELGLPV